MVVVVLVTVEERECGEDADGEEKKPVRLDTSMSSMVLSYQIISDHIISYFHIISYQT